MKHTTASHMAWALALLGAGLAPAKAAEFYRISPPSDYDTPNGVSPDGSIVLTTEHVWTRAGGLVRFAPSQGTYSRDVSNTGVVVGLTDGSYEPFRTPIGGPLQVLNTRGGDAFGITPDGNVVVGYAHFSETSIQSFRWTAAGGLEGLGHLMPRGAGYDTAHGVSADGSVVVGIAASAPGQQAFRWTRATGMVGLGDLPGGAFDSSAQAVSADGRVVVGYSASASGVSEAFRWTEATGMVGLGDLPGGNFYSRAESVTADGSVVVGTASAGDGSAGAFIWTAAQGMRSLKDVLVAEHGLGPALQDFTLWDARDISDDGRVIIGDGRDASGATLGFVAVIPEPGAASFALAAALGALARRRRGG